MTWNPIAIPGSYMCSQRDFWKFTSPRLIAHPVLLRLLRASYNAQGSSQESPLLSSPAGARRSPQEPKLQRSPLKRLTLSARPNSWKKCKLCFSNGLLSQDVPQAHAVPHRDSEPQVQFRVPGSQRVSWAARPVCTATSAVTPHRAAAPTRTCL